MRALEIFVTIFMISHFICVVLLAIFNIRYRYRVPFFLDECGFNDLAKNMSCIIEKPKVYFRQCSWHCLKTLRVCKSKHRVLTCALFAHELNNFQS